MLKKELKVLIESAKEYLNTYTKGNMLDILCETQNPGLIAGRIYRDYVRCGHKSVKERVAMLTVLENSMFRLDPVGYIDVMNSVREADTEVCINKYKTNKKRYNKECEKWNIQHMFRDWFHMYHPTEFVFHMNKRKMRH